MNKLVKAPVVAAALAVSVLGASSIPSAANAQSGNGYWYNHNNNYSQWNDDNWYDNDWYDDNYNWRISDWEARNIAQRYVPGRYIVSHEDRWDNNGRHERRYRFNDNHCVDVRDDGEVVRVIIIYV